MILIRDRLAALDLMAVHPDFQRRGAGKMIMQWGLEIADRKKIMVSGRCGTY